MGQAEVLYHDLRQAGFTLSIEPDGRLAVRPPDRISVDWRQRIREGKDGLLQLLERIRKGRPPALRRLSVSAKPTVSFDWGAERIEVFQYGPIPGRVFAGAFALDCETTLIEDDIQAVPELALVSVSDGCRHLFIHPDDVRDFILAHPDAEIVCHNAAFDFWVVQRHLYRYEETAALAVWTDLAKRSRFHDTMYLDMLLSLAGGVDRGQFRPRNLAEVAGQYAGLQLDKNDPYRQRYDEMIDRPWRSVDPGFFQYAAKDAIATFRCFEAMQAEGERFMDALDICPQPSEAGEGDAVGSFGVLTERLQTAASIALSEISRLGMHVNSRRFDKLRRQYRRRDEELVKKLNRKYPGLFKVDADGRLKRTAKNHSPSRSDKVLEECLVRAAVEIETKTGKPIAVPTTGKGRVSKSADAWEPWIAKHPFLKAWFEHMNIEKLIGFLNQLDANTVHPRYSVLKVTGRTSCSSPNMQNVPRLDVFRELVVPSPGRLLLAVDYNYVELVTLAHVCESRFGFSKLADIIRDGIDPHCYTASLLLEMGYEDFLALKVQKPASFKQWRQMAKPINFGVPGGLGANALVDYARSTYGVQMTLAQAEQFRQRLITEVYPELEHFLADTSMKALARNLHVPVDELWNAFCNPDERSPRVSGSVRKVVAGSPSKANGEPYKAEYVEKVWRKLNWLNRNSRFDQELASRRGSENLANRLFFSSVATLTGRVRGGVWYTAERNTQFQGLAADGAKLALADLVFDGYRVVGFVHDEILVEVPDEGGWVRRSVVDEIIERVRRGMARVTGQVPVSCEYTLSTCWSKRAKLIEDGDKILAWRPPAAK